MSDEYTRLVNQLLGTHLKGNDWSQWSKLTAEQMDKIRTYLPQVWSDMLEQGKYDKSEYFEDYADQAGKIEELTEQIRENLLGTTFEGLRDSFIDSLMDMEKSAEDFADEFTEMMQEALLKAAITDKYDQRLGKWYESLTDEMMNDDGSFKELSEKDIEKYRDQWNDMVEDMIEERDRIAQITGYDASTSKDTDPLTGAVQSMSEDTAGVIAGRLNAVIINMADQTEVVRNALIYQAQIAQNTGGSWQELQEIKATLKRIEQKDSSLLSQGID